MELLAFYMFDPMYFVYVGPAILLSIIAQAMVNSAYARGKRYTPQSGLSGAETAQRILQAHGIHDVGIEAARSFLGDHYDPRSKTLRLSPEVYGGRNLSAVGIAAHEVGHAIQDKTAYAPLAMRNGLVPLASIGSRFAVMVFFAGFIISMMMRSSGANIGHTIAAGGLGLFGVVVLFQLINLPVEFNASSRARGILLDQGIITTEENRIVGKVLNAAALTYVAATLSAILTMLYYASILFGRRN